MAEREMLEAASADPADAENAFDLEDACCAIDYAISVLAPFAVSEQSESDCGAAELEAVGKALAGFDAGPLEAVEGLAAVAKAGRVLSSANESLIRTAGESLQKVLMSLPSAPVADEPVTKEATVPDVLTEEALPVAKAEDAATETPEPVAKADDGEGKAKMVAVFDSKGDLVGVCDPGDITPIAGADAPASNEEEPAAAPAEPAPDAADMTPQPAAEAGTPAEDVAKADAACRQGR